VPNRAFVDAFENVNLRTGAVHYSVEVSDDYDSTILIFAEKSDVPDDDLELLKEVIKAKHNEDEHGKGSAVVKGVLDYVEEHQMPMLIGGTRYEWEQLKEIFDFDIREVFFCPKCGWESFDDSDYDVPCLRYGCDGHMSETREEWYEK
jgi:hypothetical protein